MFFKCLSYCKIKDSVINLNSEKSSMTLSKSSFYKLGLNTASLIMALFVMSHNAYAHNNDPLSEQEMAKVASLTSQPVLGARSTGTAKGDKKSLEVLLIERHQQKGAPSDQRRADIFTYDYESNELIESLVDLNTSSIIRSTRKKGVQLPLTENEIKRAKQIVFDDEDERQVLAYEYHRITSQALTDTTELNIKAFTFTADSLPNRVNEASKHCGIHRCAQLMLYTGENIVFEISPIVNLSEGIVTQRIGF